MKRYVLVWELSGLEDASQEVAEHERKRLIAENGLPEAVTIQVVESSEQYLDLSVIVR